MKCANCGKDNVAVMRFCGYCGTQLGEACAVCGFVNPPDHLFCGHCGTRLIKETDSLAPVDVPARAQAPQPVVTRVAPKETAVQLEGERRLATVILADVANSTHILEQIGTEAWVETMNHILQILEAEVYQFGGVVDQFRGDGLVAFFGATAAHEDDPERAVLAAIAMHRAVEPYAKELVDQAGVDIKVRVGVNTGEVIVASIGDERHHTEDTAMGEAITLAARMESAAEPGTVLVSENTFRLVETRFDWQPLGEITVRGISKPLSVFRPLTLRAGSMQALRFQHHDLSAFLVGREAQSEALNEQIEGLRDGQGGIAILVGDTGMGKSALIANVRQHAVRDDALRAKAEGIEPPLGTSLPRSLNWFHGRCRSYAQSSPYLMWLDMLGGWLNMPHGEPPSEARDRLLRQSEMLWGDRFAEHYPYLVTLLSLPLEDSFSQQVLCLDAEGLRQKYFETVRSWVEAMAQQAPLVLVFEDAHWADTTSLKLLDFCLSVCEREPVLWLIVFRPERASAMWQLRHHLEAEYPHRLKCLTLSPLTEEQGEKMIDRLIGQEVLSPSTRAFLRDRAEGNPYYIEEFIHALIREGVLEQDVQTGRWRATREVESLDVPDSLHNLLLARIDRLAPKERRTLQMAAVIGPVFWTNVLEALISDDPQSGAGGLKRHLAALQRAQLIKERGQATELGIEYDFESNLIRDVAYESLLSVQRVSCHRRVADALEQIFGEKVLARYYSLLTYHYRQAGVERKELFYALLAAEEARGVYANAEALEHFGRALELLDEIEAETTDERRLYAIHTQRFEVLNGRREAHYSAGDFAAGWEDAQALLPLARQLDDDPIWLIDALLEQPGVGFFRSKEEVLAGASIAQQALALARQVGDRRREMKSLAAIAGQRYHLEDPTWQEMWERALELARQLGDKRFEVSILTGIAGVYATSDPERSTEYLEAALPIIDALDDRNAELELLRVIGIQLESSVDYCRRLQECHGKELEIAREINHRPAEGRALMFYGQIQGLYLGDLEGGLTLLEECRQAFEGIPDEAYPLLRIAQIRIEQGRYDEVQEILDRIHRIGEPNLDDLGRAGLRLVSAIFNNALGDEEHRRKALELTTQTYSMSAENPQLSHQYQMAAASQAAAAHLGLARALSDEQECQQHLSLALESSGLALSIYESYGFVRPIECVSEEILFRRGLTLKASGHEDEAMGFLERANTEMMRKHDLIPRNSHYRRTYLENLSLHRKIRAAASGGGG